MLYEALGISTAEPQADQVSVPYGHGVRVEKSVTINSTPEQLYRFWRNFENLPRFMDHLKGAAFAKFFGEDPAFQVQEDLRRLKELVETGEIATTARQSSGRK